MPLTHGANGPFAEVSLGINKLTDIDENGRSDSGIGANLNGKGGMMLGPFFGGLDLNFSVIEVSDPFFGSVEENSIGLVGGINIAQFSRVYFTFNPYSKTNHDSGEYQGIGYKFGAAFFLPFMPYANFITELRTTTYDKKKVGASYQNAPDLNITSLTFSFGFFFN